MDTFQEFTRELGGQGVFFAGRTPLRKRTKKDTSWKLMLAFISLLTHSGGRFWSRPNLLTRGRKFRRQTTIFSCFQKLQNRRRGENSTFWSIMKAALSICRSNHAKIRTVLQAKGMFHRLMPISERRQVGLNFFTLASLRDGQCQITCWCDLAETCGTTCTVCNVLQGWSTRQKNEQQNNDPRHKKQ